jgi:hypothetical protein
MKRIVAALGLAVMVLGMVETADAIVFNGHDYLVVSGGGGLSWDAANADIASNYSGYHLATITSAAENTFIGNLITTGSEYWLGGLQNPITETTAGANWEWVNGEGTFWNNGSTGMYANWAGGEPNDFYGAGSEQYLGIGLLDQYSWNDEVGSGNITGYIAEKDTTSVPEPTTLLLLASGLVGMAALRRRFTA